MKRKYEILKMNLVFNQRLCDLQLVPSPGADAIYSGLKTGPADFALNKHLGVLVQPHPDLSVTNLQDVVPLTTDGVGFELKGNFVFFSKLCERLQQIGRSWSDF